MIVQLSLHLGDTLEKKNQSLTEIKNAMAAAIFCFIEANGCDCNDPHFIVCQTIYLEADHLLRQ